MSAAFGNVLSVEAHRHAASPCCVLNEDAGGDINSRNRRHR